MRKFTITTLVFAALGITVACSSNSNSTPNADTSQQHDAAAADGATGADTNDELSDVQPGTDASAAEDATTPADANGATEDSTVSDAGVTPDSAGGPVKTAWGAINGQCDEKLLQPGTEKPVFISHTYLFNKAAKFDASSLSTGPKKRYDGPNAGGSSKCSEVMSMQVLVDCAGAKVHKTETEVKYDKTGSITDYMMTLDGVKFGVSVTRAYKGPTNTNYSKADAITLLEKKLKGINDSTANVSAEDKWSRQVLHVWTLQPTWIPHLKDAWDGLTDDLRANTIVLVTVEDGTEFIVPNKCE